jgi:uncharacterized protein with HEPN domain
MIEAANRVLEYSSGLDRDAFLGHRKSCDATIRNLEIFGEAAKKLPSEIRALDTEIPWRRISGMRDVLAHAYFGIDDAIFWNVVSVEIPALLPRLVALRARLSSP